MEKKIKFRKSRNEVKKANQELNFGDVFMVADKKMAFVRIKNGGDRLVATDILNGKHYNVTISLLDERLVIGKAKLPKIK